MQLGEALLCQANLTSDEASELVALLLGATDSLAAQEALYSAAEAKAGVKVDDD